MLDALKIKIVDFWNKKPCGTMGAIPEAPNLEYFENIRSRRYRLEPFIKTSVNFGELKDKRVLEIGCGVGTDGIEFLKAGADYTGVDVSQKSAELARINFELHGFDSSNVLNADVEKLPFEDGFFDFIYSWGVIHHTPDMQKAIDEVRRVLRPGGSFCIMLYNRFSLVGFQLYAIYGLLRLKPLISFKELFYNHHESVGTKALTHKEAFLLFKKFRDVGVENIVTPYDLRITRNIFLPSFFSHFVPSRLGFFKVITGRK